jgi:hypothetical protein
MTNALAYYESKKYFTTGVILTTLYFLLNL